MSSALPKEGKKKSLVARIKDAWDRLCSVHPWLARIAVALLVALVLWTVFYFLLFSGMNESADFIYAKF